MGVSLIWVQPEIFFFLFSCWQQGQVYQKGRNSSVMQCICSHRSSYWCRGETERIWQADRPINHLFPCESASQHWLLETFSIICGLLNNQQVPSSSAKFCIWENNLRIQWVTYLTRSKNLQIYFSSLLLFWVSNLNHFCCHFSTHNPRICLSDKVSWNLQVKVTIKQLNFTIRCS